MLIKQLGGMHTVHVYVVDDLSREHVCLDRWHGKSKCIQHQFVPMLAAKVLGVLLQS